MAAKRNDLLGRLADLSEDAIQRLSDVPGADKAVAAVNALRERTDELQKRVRGLEGLEARIADLEKKVDKLSKASSPRSTARKTTTTKSSSAKKA